MASSSYPGVSSPTLVSLLQQECSYRPSASSLESLLERCDTRRYSRSMVRNRPEIIRAVPARVIASYLGVSPEYLSRIRKGMLSDRH